MNHFISFYKISTKIVLDISKHIISISTDFFLNVFSYFLSCFFMVLSPKGINSTVPDDSDSPMSVHLPSQGWALRGTLGMNDGTTTVVSHTHPTDGNGQDGTQAVAHLHSLEY